MRGVPNKLERVANGTTGPEPAWKQELNEKLASARAKRHTTFSGSASSEANALSKTNEPESRAARVAAAVAARYAKAPTFSELLAAEELSAMTAAAAANALAVEQAEIEAARQRSLAEETREEAQSLAEPAASRSGEARVDYAALGISPGPASHDATAEGGARKASSMDVKAERVQKVLGDPVEEAFVTPATPLPAKLIEFPRELVAARKARPRHAEGPLRDGAQHDPAPREVASDGETAAQRPAEWSTIRLDTYPEEFASEAIAHRQGEPERSPLKVASLPDRLMAAIVDLTLVGIAFVLIVYVFAAIVPHVPLGKQIYLAAGVLFAVLNLIYQVLFFSFGEGTPGMSYARISLCTFDDGHPTRGARRKRIFAWVLAAMPLGLGLLYALFDEDHLGWHDRMTRMYQRSYR